MEPVVVSIVGAIVGSSMTMVLRLVEEGVKELKVGAHKKLEDDASAMGRELSLIEDTIDEKVKFGASIPEGKKKTLRICIGILACLVDDLEDCLDCYRGGMRTAAQFAEEIGKLKANTVTAHEQLQRYLGANPPIIDDGNAQAPADPLQGLEVSSRNCLLYSCMFPLHHPARRNALIRRSLAEELAGETDVINNLQALIPGNNIQSIEKSNNGSVKIWQPAEGILQGIQDHSMLQYPMSVCRIDDHVAQQAGHVRGNELVGHVRRLFVHPSGVANGGRNLPKVLSHLRTLAIFPPDNPANYEGILKFSSYKVLRLLDLKKCDHMNKNHLKAIFCLLLLKYLSFGGTISRIPRKIADLQQLETLDVGRSKTVKVYAEVLLLPKLKHLLGKFKLHPLDFYLKGKKIRNFLSGGSVLETLSGFATGKRQGFPQLMISLTRLKKVKIWCEATADQANKNHLVAGIKTFIQGDRETTKDRSLSIDFTEGSAEFLQSIEEAPVTLISLKLSGGLTEVPPFVTNTSTHIVELCLSSTNLGWEKIITSLSGLDRLHYLKLIEDNLGPVEIQPEKFPRLKRICLVGKHSLGVIAIQDGALPQLVSLRLICEDQNLQGITIGAQALPNLISLHLLCKPLDDLAPAVLIAPLDQLEEVALSEVDESVKGVWRTAVSHHRNTPKLSFITKRI